MTGAWRRGALRDFAEFVSTGPFGSMLHKADYISDGIPLINPTNIEDQTIVPDPNKQVGSQALKRLSHYVLSTGDVVVGRRGEIGRCAVIGAAEAGWVCGTGCFFIRPAPSIDPNFLAHLLRSPRYRDELEQASTGATMKNMSNRTLAELQIEVPDKIEQQHIVAILDQAFEGIAAAKANAEKNLQNSRELFEGYLKTVFAQTGASTSLIECSRSISDGDHAPPPKSSTGVPFITISNVDKESRRIDFHDTFKVSREYFDGLKSHRKPTRGDVLYTVTGSFGIPVLVEDESDFCFQRHIGLIRPNSDVDSKWLAYALLSPQVRAQAEAGATGTAQRTVSLSVLRSIRIPKTALEDQRAIANKVDAFEKQCRRLGSIAKAKLAALDELKRSLLNQVFSCRLSSSKQTSVARQLVLQTATPEFTANVISFAHARHERLKRDKTFGHVKEQKILHLVESIAGLDLGRRPIRDAAGPNDFQHMLKAEEWAKAHGFFDIVKSGRGYEFRKLSAFDQHMSRARKSLAPYLPELERIIDLLVPMDTEEAEVFATVHAAWNNLLIDGIPASDDAIVSAARESWHPDKLNIPENKFRNAIDKIRQKRLVPDGSAKYVGGQQSLI